MPKKTKPKNGFVWIVGAGPGDAHLLTLKAKECLEQIDVIVYDRLVTPSFLSLARPDAELIYAGKTPKVREHLKSGLTKCLSIWRGKARKW